MNMKILLMTMLSISSLQAAPSKQSNFRIEWDKASLTTALNAASLSPERRQLAAKLKQWNLSNDEESLRGIVQKTAESLEHTPCTAQQKIRAYKSVGSESLGFSASSKPILISALWREQLIHEPKLKGPEFSWSKLQLPWKKFFKMHTMGEQPTEFISFSLNPLYVSEQGPAYIVAEFCPERIILPPVVGKDLQELEVLVPLFVMPEEIVSVKGIECLKISDPLKQKDCAGVLADNVATLNDTSKSARRCYSNMLHDLEYKYMDDSPADLVLINRYEMIAPEFQPLFTKLMNVNAFRIEFLSTLKRKCDADCKVAADYQKALMELSENGESELDADVIEMDAKRFEQYIKGQCPDNGRK